MSHLRKLPFSRTDFWGIITLTVFIGFIYALAVAPQGSNGHSFEQVINSTGSALPAQRGL